MSEITDEITEQEMAVIEQIAETVAKAVFQNIAKMTRKQQQTGKNLSGNVTDRTNQIAQALTKAIYQNVMRMSQQQKNMEQRQQQQKQQEQSRKYQQKPEKKLLDEPGKESVLEKLKENQKLVAGQAGKEAREQMKNLGKLKNVPVR